MAIKLPDAISSREITVARGANRHERVWKNVTGTFQQLFDGYLSKHRVGQKDGQAITQGKLAGQTRSSPNAWLNYLVMIDIDNGTPLEEIEQILKDSGLFGVIYTTHSHLKPQTTIKEKALDDWVKTQPDMKDATDVEKATRYLAKVKKYASAILDSITAVGVAMLDGGRQYVVEHAPMHRARVVFILDEPFDFANRGKQVEAIAEWKATYTNFCKRLGVAWDSTCIDPARLMYTPCRGSDSKAEDHKVIVVDGEPLTIERMKIPADDVDDAPVDELDAFAAPADPNSKFKTPGLRQFAAKHAHDFAAADWFSALNPDGDRGSRQNGPGLHFQCPNEDNHSVISPEDTAFMVVNGEDGADGFTALCMHATCKDMSGGDRLWYVDKMCQAHGIRHADELLAHCSGEAREQAHTTARAETIVASGTLDERIEALTPETPIETVVDIITALAQTPRTLVVDTQISRVAEKTGGGLRSTQAEYRRQRGIVEARERGDAPGIQRQPTHMETYRGPVMLHWHETVQDQITLRLLMEKNEEDPFLFIRPEGGVVRLKQTALGMTLDPIDTPQKWGNILSEHVSFQKLDETHGDSVFVKAPIRVIHELQGKVDWELPIIDRIIRVPVLGRDGSLRTEKGYDPDTQTYVDPHADFLPVPDDITPEILLAAIDTVIEPLRDFPFSDVFDGSDQLPIKLDEEDEDGFPYPNYERGKSSRIHALAMMIQPFVRDIIDGPCPAYHIGKAAAGTGAGYLADVIYYTTEGEGAVAQTMAENAEEFRKSITATLRSGATNIFIDNINKKVDSGHLAAALTAGKWKDRVLGISETCQIPIKSTWMMAGNNLTFSHELMRRIVPIYMDANSKNPAHDRLGKKDFKHFPLQTYLKEHRLEIVQAIHILIMNWVRTTDMAWGSKRMNSFDAYAGVMSGIFEAAGIEDFLDNIPAYLNDNDEDQDDDDGLIDILYERFKMEDKFTPTEAFGVIDTPMSPVSPEALGIEGNTTAAKVATFGRYLAKSCKGRTFTPVKDDPTVKVKLTKKRVTAGVEYRFVPAT